MSERRARLLIAGTGSGAGKTTVTIGLMAALQRRGLQVQGFKCGPDYIDPSYHTSVTGRQSRNLDTWMLPHDTMKEIFLRGSAGADVSVIEGVMGMFDGKDPLSDTGSSAEIAALLNCPVLLVVSAQSMARSAAAIVLGFQQLAENVHIAGVILNKCGSSGHYKLVKSAIEQVCGIPVLGWLGRDDELRVPERHLGLVPAIERGELEPLYRRAAEHVEMSFDLDAILKLAGDAPDLQWPESRLFADRPHQSAALRYQPHQSGIFADQPRMSISTETGPLIAVAKDAAFNFYYPENLELLEQLGARVTLFSPLAGQYVPAEADGVYIGGGFPEEFAAQLAANRGACDDLKARAEGGLPVFAECGGYMYLTRTITDRAGETHDMVGLIPARVKMQSKLAALGYREVRARRNGLLLQEGETIRGHEFHYSALTPDDPDGYPYAYETKGLRGVSQDGFALPTLTAGYTHVHFASNVSAARRFVEQCAAYRVRKGRTAEESGARGKS
ncbi:cobyrinate a,c-diamide synthase [Paenibacillus beijingensis]|uniref:Cobyrinate a,c-diamide synthase n=1 Tax=Paenibacillus beijingensis TaxID=1126833 RepID=A0A0D5NNN3_9BACL|nr:cobyrinate a,c-diamide synthase [Paenibacillus beijingensis]AJY76924.1 cobyrinic acid a,c-diamide synthase [Paenibacillus beijingensis]